MENWRMQAECWGMNPELFFPLPGPEIIVPVVAEACGRCPVRNECLDFGMHEPAGIWGGLTSRQRRRLSRSKDRRWVAA